MLSQIKRGFVVSNKQVSKQEHLGLLLLLFKHNRLKKQKYWIGLGRG